MDRDILLILFGATVGFVSSLLSTFIQSWIKKREYKFQQTEERKKQLRTILLPTIEEIEKYSGKSSRPKSGFELRRPKPFVFILSGHFCSGKTEIIKRLKEDNFPLHFIANTIAQSEGNNEVERVNDFFVSVEKFEQLIGQGEFAYHTYIYGEYSGILKKNLIEAFASGEDIILSIDVQGAIAIRKLIPEAILIFITKANEEEVINCIEFQKSRTTSSSLVNIDIIRQELAHIENFEYLIVNTDTDESVNLVNDIITTEHLRVFQIERQATLQFAA